MVAPLARARLTAPSERIAARLRCAYAALRRPLRRAKGRKEPATPRLPRQANPPKKKPMSIAPPHRRHDTQRAMSDALQTTRVPRTHQDVQAGARTVRISRRVKAAVEAMVWQGMKRGEAAQATGMKDNSLYVAFRRPEVRAYYLSECEVLRVSGRARRIHRLEGLVEQDENKMAAVQASRTLDNMGEDAQARSGVQASPWLTIRITNVAAAPAPITIEHKPLELEGDDPNDPTIERLREPRFRDPTDPNR
jgi:hypothetical protein